MIYMDTWLADFIGHNYATLGLIFAILKAAAKATPWAVDDEIVQILTGYFTRKGGSK